MVSLFDHRQSTPEPTPIKSSALLKEWRLVPRFLEAQYRLFFSEANSHYEAPVIVNECVVLVPGFGAGELTLEPLRRYFLKRGIPAEHWGLGANRGNAERDCHRLIERLQVAYSRSGIQITLVGWSMGGVIAREVARAIPDVVKRVVTLGAPVVGGPTFTLAAGFWGEARCKEIAQRLAVRDIDQPVTAQIIAFFSKNDGVVSWPACIDRVSHRVVHYEVAASHWALGFDWQVWEKMYELFLEARREAAVQPFVGNRALS